MVEKVWSTSCGDIHYWTSLARSAEGTTNTCPCLVMLPGLTADRRLFEKQVEHFEGKCNMLVWDAPGHAASRPFSLTFSLFDQAKWLKEILDAEGILQPVIVGQSMGGYVGQAYVQLFPGELHSFISIDSAPLQRSYLTAPELWFLKHTQLIYRLYPWGALLKAGSNGVAITEYGRALMRKMMLTYEGQHAYYAKFVGHGYRILAQAYETDLPFELTCPAMLICGEEDRVGSTLRYNKAWHAKTGIPIHWIKGAGHNSNTDNPDAVNSLIEGFLACQR